MFLIACKCIANSSSLRCSSHPLNSGSARHHLASLAQKLRNAFARANRKVSNSSYIQNKTKMKSTFTKLNKCNKTALGLAAHPYFSLRAGKLVKIVNLQKSQGDCLRDLRWSSYFYKSGETVANWIASQGAGSRQVVFSD